MGTAAALLVPLLLGASPSARLDSTRWCRPADLPIELPAVDAIVDSTALWRFFRDVAIKGMPRSTVISIGFEAEGTLRHPQLLERNMGGDSAIAIGRFVVSIVRPQAHAKDLWAVRLHIVLSDTARFSIERSESCPAVIDDASRQVMEFTMRGPVDFRHITPARLRVLVEEDGSVSTVNVIQSSSIPALEQTLVDRYRGRHFRPATLDGIPVRSWFDTGSSRIR
jgi:hypothetical protein